MRGITTRKRSPITAPSAHRGRVTLAIIGICALAGAVPLKESVVGLNVSQPGSAWPFCCVAV